jgi:hypothetical protein
LYDIHQLDTNSATGQKDHCASPVVGYNLGFNARLRDVSIVSPDECPSRPCSVVSASEKCSDDKISRMYLLLENGRLHSLDINAVDGKIVSSDLRFESSECFPFSNSKVIPCTNSLREGYTLAFLKQSRLLLYQCKSQSVIALFLNKKGFVDGSFELLPHSIPASMLEEGTVPFSGPYTHWTELGVVYRETGAFFRLACVGRSTMNGQMRLLCLEFNETCVKVKDLKFSDQSSSFAGYTSLEGLTAVSSPILGASSDGNWLAGERVFLLALSVEGKLMCFGDDVLDLVPISLGEKGGRQATLPIKLVSLPAEEAETKKPPLTVFENLTNATETEDLIIFGEGLGITGVDLKERLSRDCSLSLSCPLEGSSIVFALQPRIPPTRLVLSAIRILLGSSPECLPRKIRVQGRDIEVTPGEKRWYNIVLTEEEVALVARTGYISVLVSPTRDFNHRPVVDSIEIFASKAELATFPRSYFATHSSKTPTDSLFGGINHWIPVKGDPIGCEVSLEHAVNAAASLSQLLRSPTHFSAALKKNFWDIVESTVALRSVSFKQNLRKLAAWVERDASEREKQYDGRVLKGCFDCLDKCSSCTTKTVSESYDTKEGESDMLWRSIYDVVNDCMEISLKIAKDRPINFLQSSGTIVDKCNSNRSIAVAASDIVVKGRCQLQEFDTLTAKVVELLLTEMALNLLSDESTKHRRNFPTLGTMQEYLESQDDDVVDQCCFAICSFFEEHTYACLNNGDPDMFEQLEAARLVAYQCDGCLVCPMKQLRYTFLEEDEGIE